MPRLKESVCLLLPWRACSRTLSSSAHSPVTPKFYPKNLEQDAWVYVFLVSGLSLIATSYSPSAPGTLKIY